MRQFENILRRIASLEPAPSFTPCGIEALTDEELDAKIKSLVQRAEQRGGLDCLHKELTCEGCTGNNRISWCYSWKENSELQICSPKAAGT